VVHLLQVCRVHELGLIWELKLLEDDGRLPWVRPTSMGVQGDRLQGGHFRRAKLLSGYEKLTGWRLNGMFRARSKLGEGQVMSLSESLRSILIGYTRNRKLDIKS
jgi:hypothetical protein